MNKIPNSLWGSHRKLCLILCCLLVPSLVGCTAVNESQKDGSEPTASLESVLDAQEQWLLSLKTEQPMRDLTIPVSAQGTKDHKLVLKNNYYSSVTSHDGRLYQYIQAMFPRTNVLYGLYFEDGKLSALLLDQDVYDFHVCELIFRRGEVPADHLPENEKDIPPYTIAPVNEWIRNRNRLGTNFNARVAHQQWRDEKQAVHIYGEPPATTSSEVTSAEVIEAIALLPLGLMGATMLGITYSLTFFPPTQTWAKKEWSDLMEGGQANIGLERQQLDRIANQIRPGLTTEDELTGLMGAPFYKFSRQSEQVSYLEYSIERYTTLGFGVKNGLVIWKEFGQEYQPRNGSTKEGGLNCEKMRF